MTPSPEARALADSGAISLLEQARRLPHGTEQVSLTEQAVALAQNARDEKAEVSARLELVKVLSSNGQEWKAVEPFLWCLARCADRSDLFDEEQVAMIGHHYCWVGVAAAANPRISVSQVGLLERGLEVFAQQIGMSERSLLDQHRVVHVYLGRSENASEALQRWRQIPPDETTCDLCEPMRTLSEALESQDWEDAVRYAAPVLESSLTCDRQPADIKALSLVPMLLSGRPNRAWRYHMESYLVHRRQGQDRAWVSSHLAFLALSGRIDRGLRLLRRHAHTTRECHNAIELLDLVTGVSMILREAVRSGRGHELVGADLPVSPLEVTGHHVEACETVLEAYKVSVLWRDALCKAFDQRNGNRSISEAVRRFIALEPLIDSLIAGPVVHLFRASEPLPEPLATSEVVPLPACVAVRTDPHQEVLGDAEIGDVDLWRREHQINLLLADGDDAASASALRLLAEDLLQAGRALEGTGIIEMGLDAATRAGDQATAFALHRLAVTAMGTLGAHWGKREFALACAEDASRQADGRSERFYTEVAATSSLSLRDTQTAAQLFERCADTVVGDVVEDRLGRERYLRRAARSLAGDLSVRRRTLAAEAARKHLAEAGRIVELLEHDVSASTLDLERRTLHEDLAWVEEQLAEGAAASCSL